MLIEFVEKSIQFVETRLHEFTSLMTRSKVLLNAGEQIVEFVQLDLQTLYDGEEKRNFVNLRNLLLTSVEFESIPSDEREDNRSKLNFPIVSIAFPSDFSVVERSETR